MDMLNATVKQFLSELSSDAPTPGGGSVAGLCGAIGASLVSMVSNLTIGREKYADFEGEMKSAQIEAIRMQGEFMALAGRDMEVFQKYMSALKMPKATEEEKQARREALDVAVREATNVPLDTVELAVPLAGLASDVLCHGNRNAASDAVAAVQLARAAAKVASYNVSINLPSIKDDLFAEDAKKRVTEALAKIEGYVDEADRRMGELCAG